MSVFLVVNNGKQAGPYAIDRIRQLLLEGSLSADDLCWCDGMTEWVQISQLPTIYQTPPPLSSAQLQSRGATAHQIRKVESNLETGARVVSDSRLCMSCEREYKYGWRCRDCQGRLCDACAKGGRSTTTGKVFRFIAGVSTYGLSEAARAGYRNIKKACPRCGNKDMMRI